MKFEWEPQDVKNGRKVDSHNRAERYIIGYDPKSMGKDCLVLVSTVDGMIIAAGHTHESMAANLTEGRYRPVDIDLEDHLPRED